jgi:hypothetical protein
MMSPQALAIAIKDLQDKLSAEGRADAIKKIAMASGLNPDGHDRYEDDDWGPIYTGIVNGHCGVRAWDQACSAFQAAYTKDSNNDCLPDAGMRLLNHGLGLIKKSRIPEARAFIELPLRMPKVFRPIDLNPIRRINDLYYPVTNGVHFENITTKNRTAVLLGSGPSINLIKNTISAEIDVWTFNNFAIHPKIVPDFYHIEVNWGRPEKMAWFQSILETKKQIYRQTKFLVHEKEYPSYRIFIPNDLKLLHYDKLKTNNPHGTCSLGRLLALMHHLSYETIYMVGIDLYCAEYFWANYDGIPDFMRCNQAEEGRQPRDLHATVLKNDIVNAVSMFIHANRINVVNLSPESLFADRLPTQSVAVLYEVEGSRKK